MKKPNGPKVSSQDCVDFAVQNFPEIGDLQTGKKGWTRLRKFKTEGGIMRHFQLFSQSSIIRGAIGYWDLSVLEAPDGTLSASLAARRFNIRGKEIDDAGVPISEEVPEEARRPADPKGAEGPKFIFATTKVDSVEGTVFLINTVLCWKRRHCLTDNYTERERKVLDPIFDSLGLTSLMESHYEGDGTKTPEEIKKGLEAVGIPLDEEFQKWIDRPVEEEEE